MIIIGAGMAGLLAARMLARREPWVYERQTSLPNNHSAVLRFRTDAVSLVTGIPFKRVRVLKAVNDHELPLASAVKYSRKVNSRISVRSIIDTATVERFIAPVDFIQQLAAGAHVTYNSEAEQLGDMRDWTAPVISTMPMPALMDLLDYKGPRPEFRSKAGTVWTATVPDCELYATIYYPGDQPYYRASITGDQLIVECTKTVEPPINWERAIKRDFGLGNIELSPWLIKTQKYAKIDHTTERETSLARTFMHWATVNHNIYSLGRFATWRAGLLLDDLVKDVQKIDRWVGAGDKYAVSRDL